MQNMTLVLNKKEGYTQGEIDLLFNVIVPKIMYGFSVYEPHVSDLTAVQSFKQDITRSGTIYLLVITSMSYWEKSGCHLFLTLKYCDHSLNYNLSPYKDISG